MPNSPSAPSTGSRAARYARFIEHHAGLVFLGFLAITALFGFSLRRLELRTSFEDLLPEGQPSVVALRQIMKRVGGMGTLNVGIESPDKAANKRFAEDLIARIRTRMSKEVHSIDYTMAPIREFYQKNGVLYLSLKDLQELDRALADSIKQAKLKANPLYLDMEDDEGKDGKKSDPAQRVRELEKKARAQAAGADKFPEGYYIGEKGRLLAIFLRPNGSALEIKGAREFIAKMQTVVDELNPRRYHRDMRVGFTGSIKVTVEEHEAIARDLAGTTLLCLALVGLAVWLYFRRMRVLGLIAVPLAAGAVWAFGIAAITEGSVNAQTAFLGSIIVGTGINYGIMLLGRYMEERRRGEDTSSALAIALGTCFKATLIAGLATAIAFGGLGIAHIKSFSQFGLVGGLGMVFCWFLSFTMLPALLCLVERIPWLRLRAAKPPRLQIHYPRWLARIPVQRPVLVTTVFCSLVVVSLVLVGRFLPHSLETDVNNLRNKPSVKTGTNVLDNRIADMMGESLTPAVVLAEDANQALQICRAFDKVRAAHPERPPVEYCRSLHSFLPEQQEQKLAVVGRIRDRLKSTPKDLLPDEVRKHLDELQGRVSVGALTLNDLPDQIRRRFRDKNGVEGVISLVGPGDKLGLYNVNDLYAFTDALREIRLENGQVIHSSGDMVVFADILRSIGVDAPRTTVLAGAGVLLMLVIVLRRRTAVVRISAALGAGVTLMCGIAAAMGLKFNFFNFVALPTSFGIGVDYPVNIHERYHQDGRGSMVNALAHTGPAVFIAALTTIIGYAVLLTSNSMVLVSFGKLAIIGELTCLATAMLFLPALVSLSERRSAATQPQTAPDGTGRKSSQSGRLAAARRAA